LSVPAAASASATAANAAESARERELGLIVSFQVGLGWSGRPLVAGRRWRQPTIVEM